MIRDEIIYEVVMTHRYFPSFAKRGQGRFLKNPPPSPFCKGGKNKGSGFSLCSLSWGLI